MKKEEGDRCFDKECDGVYEFEEPENCYCHNCAPCSVCTSLEVFCNNCGLDGNGE